MPRQRRWKTEAESLPILRRLYHSVSLGGAKRLIDAAREEGVRPMIARNWLESDLAYTLHKPARRRLSRNRVLVNGKDEQWQADLVDMQQEAEENDGYKYLLTVIDVLSKHACVAGGARAVANRCGERISQQTFSKVFENQRRAAFRDLQRNQGSNSGTL